MSNFKIETTKSNVKHIYNNQNIQELISELKGENYKIVAYLDYSVLIGYLDNSGKMFFYDNQEINLDFLQKIRFFNNQEELYIWKSGENFNGRFRNDQMGEEIDFVEVSQVLFGTASKKLDDKFTSLTENKRGIEIIIPGSFTAKDDKQKVAIKTRNYIDYNEIHQATYVDCRFIDFIQLQ